MDGIVDLLRADEATRGWVAYLEAFDEPTIEVTVPAPEDLPALLLTLAVPHDDIDDIVAMRPRLDEDRQLRWLVERCTSVLTCSMGSVDRPPPFPVLPAGLRSLHRYVYIYVFLAALPYVEAFHRARGVAADVSRLTLADLGRNMAVHRRRYGVGGLAVPYWLMLHFRGAIYQVGRLQFERTVLGRRTGAAVQAAGLPYGPGAPAVGVHVPAYYGPLTPSACDVSIAAGRQFFARHFPEEEYRVATCSSWLLDSQLAEYLPERSNILAFQRRFRPAYRPDANDEEILRFVFGRVAPVAELPRRTRLERAVADHLVAGRRWYGGSGWFAW